MAEQGKKRAAGWLLAAFSGFVCALALFFVRTALAGRLYDQNVTSTWAEDGQGVSQISVFWPIGRYAQENTIRRLEYDIAQELVKVSADEGDGASFVTCMSAQGSVTLMREGTGRSVQARAVGTYGDFFRFHPITLLSGSLYAQNALTPDRVLIDEDLAWQLFGSFDVAGQTVMIGGIAHTVAGVFSLPADGTIEKQAGVPENLCFLSLSSLCQSGTVGADKNPSAAEDLSAGGASGSASSGAAAVGTTELYGISAWEIVMPDPVKNFALHIVEDKTGAGKGEALVVENSVRFLPAALRANLRGSLTRGMRTEPVVFPYWENIARGYTNLFSLLWLLQTILTVFSCGVLAVFAVLLWRRRTWTFAGFWRALMDRKYDFESRMKYAHDKWEHF